MTKLIDIADRLGIAASTVSKGLNGANDISEDLRHQIIETAVEMGYVTKRMRKEKHRKLAVVFEGVPFENKTDPGYALALGFKQLAQKANWTVELLEITPELQGKKKYDSFILRHGLSGAFLVGIQPDDPWMEQFQTCKSPAVFMDQATFGPKVATLGIDSDSLFDDILGHLLEQSHNSIAYLSGAKGATNDELRKAFTDACQRANLDAKKCPIAMNCTTKESVEEYVNSFIDSGVTAFICCDDAIAEGVYTEASLLGYSIPNDISVVGYGDLAVCNELTPALTSVRTDAILIGKSAFNTLNGLLEHLPIKHLSLASSIVYRESTGNNKNA